VQRVAPAGQNADFWPVSKNNTGSLPQSSKLPVLFLLTVLFLLSLFITGSLPLVMNDERHLK